MDLRLIISTFFVIFMAELGDKTQFAAMAASAGSNKPLSILLGTVLALTLSSVIAVAAGGLIGNLIPVKYIKMAAGILFIVFGILYIREAFSIEESPAEVTAQEGIWGESILHAARTFEKEELEMMKAAKDKILNQEFATVLGQIVEQEKNHLSLLGKISEEETTVEENAVEWEAHKNLEESFSCSDEDDETLTDVFKRELAMADFYRLMSEKNKIPSVKSAFNQLYQEEKEHAGLIQELLDKC